MSARTFVRSVPSWTSLASVVAALVGVACFLVVAVTLVYPAAAQSDADFVLDGSIDEAAYGSFGELAYRTDAGEDIPNGLISVVETDSSYWIGFQQSATAKSNAYCSDEGEQEGCYQKFNSLVGSDHISFTWEDVATTDGGSQPLTVGVDVLSECEPGEPVKDNPSITCGSSGYVGGVNTGDGEDLEWGEDKLKDDPDLAESVQGFSSLHYDFNTVGWSDTENSPNFTTGDEGEGFVYASIAEVRLDKSTLGLPGGLERDLAQAEVITHNSPWAPFEDEPTQLISCVDTAARSLDVGDTTTFAFEARENNEPAAGLDVLVLLRGGPGEVVSVGGDSGNIGETGSDGRVDVVVRATDVTDETRVVGVIDTDRDGTWDEATEATTSPPCRFFAQQAPPPPPPDITTRVDKTNDADADGVFTDDEQANAPADAVDFRAIITNTSDVPVVIRDLEDTWSTNVGAVALDLLDPAGFDDNSCVVLDGVVLAPGDSETCFFTVPDYAPPRDTSQDNVVAVEVEEEGNPDNRARDTDDTRVRTPPVDVGPEQEQREPPAVAPAPPSPPAPTEHPPTGIDGLGLATVAVALIALGGGLLVLVRGPLAPARHRPFWGV